VLERKLVLHVKTEVETWANGDEGFIVYSKRLEKPRLFCCRTPSQLL
jgi:hypothetical protein